MLTYICDQGPFFYLTKLTTNNKEREIEMKEIRSIVKNEKGATLVEYGLIVSVIALAITGVLLSFGSTIDGTLDTVSTNIDSVQQDGNQGGE